MEYDAVGVVTTGRMMFAETAKNIFDTSLPIKHGVRMATSPYWDQTLTGVVEGALEAGSEYILFYDGDGVWTREDVDALYKIIDHDDKVDAVFPVQADRFGERPLVWNWMTEKFGHWYDYRQPVMRYPHGHFGLTFIRRRVFETMPRPWFWSKPSPKGTWKTEDGKMDADTYFWLKLYQHQTGDCCFMPYEPPQPTGNVCLLANCVSVGHMELHVRWQQGPNVVIQTIPQYYQHGKPPGCRNPFPMEYDDAKMQGQEKATEVEPLPEVVEV